MDGQVKYTGAANDRDPILQNIGGSVPSNTRVEQLPERPAQLFMFSNCSGSSKSFSRHNAITACRSSIFLPFTRTMSSMICG